jgi:Caspase domain
VWEGNCTSARIDGLRSRRLSKLFLTGFAMPGAGYESLNRWPRTIRWSISTALAWHRPAANLPLLILGNALGMHRPLSNWTQNRRALAAIIALVSLLSAGPAAAEKRIALVVGNSAYQNITQLDNPRNDATLMAETLAGLGFTLIGGSAQLDLDKAALDTDVQNFGRQIQGADVALFYYAGHGVQVNAQTIWYRSAPTRPAKPTSISRWWTSISCCARCKARARGLT